MFESAKSKLCLPYNITIVNHINTGTVILQVLVHYTSLHIVLIIVILPDNSGSETNQKGGVATARRRNGNDVVRQRRTC